MKRLTAFLLVALIGWNIVLTILYLQSKEDTTAATAAQQTKQKVEALSGSFLPGDRVSHPKFGEGTVQGADARTVTVAFADGTKKLAIGFAPIKKI